MTERINVTTETAESPVFSPADDFFVQVSATRDTATFDVMARVDSGAVWEVIDTLKKSATIGRYKAMPFVKIVLKGNKAGDTAKAWSSP